MAIKTVAVTGAAGLIGTEVVAQLLQKGYTVHGMKTTGISLCVLTCHIATVRSLSEPDKIAHLRELETHKGKARTTRQFFSFSVDFHFTARIIRSGTSDSGIVRLGLGRYDFFPDPDGRNSFFLIGLRLKFLIQRCRRRSTRCCGREDGRAGPAEGHCRSDCSRNAQSAYLGGKIDQYKGSGGNVLGRLAFPAPSHMYYSTSTSSH